MPYFKTFQPRLLRLCIAAAVTIICFACGGSGAPLDADTRAAIDSASTAQINLARMELDSACVAAEKTQMKHLVDSIKQVRLKEIAEQLRVVPK